MLRQTLFFFFGIATILHAEEAVELSYVPNKPVVQSMITEHHFQQTSDGDITKGDITQKLVTNITLNAELNELPISEGPSTLALTLQRMSGSVLIDEESFSYDSENPEKSMEIAELKELVDRPMTFKLTKNLKLERDSEEFNQAMKELPATQSLQLQNAIFEGLEQTFALAGRKLQEDKTITDSNYHFQIFEESIPVSYRISKIDKETIEAELTFSVPQEKRDIEIGKGSDGDAITIPAMVSASGEGTVTWNRSNALLYNANLKYRLNTELTDGFTFKNEAHAEMTISSSLK